MELTLMRELRCHLTVYHPFRPLRTLFDGLAAAPGALDSTGSVESYLKRLDGLRVGAAAAAGGAAAAPGAALGDIARSVEELAAKSSQEITVDQVKLLYKKYKKCRDPRNDPNSSFYVRVRRAPDGPRARARALSARHFPRALEPSPSSDLASPLPPPRPPRARRAQESDGGLETELKVPIERSAESAERSLLGMHSMDMDDDEEEGNDGSGFLIRRSKRRRRDGDPDISISSVDSSFDQTVESKRGML
jgi:hypothetical protein